MGEDCIIEKHTGILSFDNKSSVPLIAGHGLLIKRHVVKR